MTNNRVEVRVATPVFNVRRRLARDRLAADATGRRRGRSLACGPAALERSAVAHDRRLRVAGTGGAPSHRGVMDASRWSGGRRCRDLRDPQTGEPPVGRLLAATIAGALTMLGPGRLSIDARLFGWKRIDATSAQEIVRAWAEPGTPRPKGSPARHPTESSQHTLVSPLNSP